MSPQTFFYFFLNFQKFLLTKTLSSSEQFVYVHSLMTPVLPSIHSKCHECLKKNYKIL